MTRQFYWMPVDFKSSPAGVHLITESVSEGTRILAVLFSLFTHDSFKNFPISSPVVLFDIQQTTRWKETGIKTMS